MAFSLPGAPAGSTTKAPYEQVSGTGLTLGVAGQTVAGDFAFTSGSGQVTIAVANGAPGLEQSGAQRSRLGKGRRPS